MTKLTCSVVFLATWGMLSACSNSHTMNQAQNGNIQAPKNQTEAQSRFIIKGTSADTAAVINASESYRTLSLKHNIYEIKGLNYFEIKDIAPLVQAEQNQFVKDHKILKTVNPYKNSQFESLSRPASGFMYADSQEEQNLINQNIKSQELPPALQGCDIAAVGQPTAHLAVKNDVLQTSPTMELGQTVIFDGSKSQSIDPTQGDVVIQWDILPPDGSKITSGLRVGDTFEITTDMVGEYLLLMVARDPSNACALIQGRFLVTHNPEFEFAVEGETLPTVNNLEIFKHLNRVQAHEAWEVATGKGVTIAVLDSGLHYSHPGIKYNLAINNSERYGATDIDDNENGFKDDVLGWDFVNNDNKPFDDQGHGSHVAGLAASHVYGIARDAKILPVKVMGASGSGDTASIIAGIYYAVDNGADIINASLGGPNPQVNLFMEAVEYAHLKQVTFVSASGNSTLDLSAPGNEIYPGELNVANVVNVAAVGIDQNLASYSNFGKQETDVAAPGGDKGEPLYSLATLNPHDVEFVGQGGTSMAAPIVAGVAALVKEVYPDVTPEEMRTILMTSGQDYIELAEVVGSGKILNAFEAVNQAVALSTGAMLVGQSNNSISQ